MRRIWFLLFAVALLSSCNLKKQYDSDKMSEECGMLVLFQSDAINRYFYDRDTKVIYAVSYYYPFPIVLVDSTGKPKLYKQNIK